MKNGNYIKIGIVLLVLLSSLAIKAQSGRDIDFYYIEKLTSESYSSWITSLERNEAISVVYSCIPANIIGIKGDFKEQLSLSLKNANLNFKSIAISEKEAIEKCASKRKL